MTVRRFAVAVCTMSVFVFDAAAGDSPLDRAVYEGLRDVINHGAKVFNEQGDYHGCVRIFQGGLLAVRSSLAHRPELQKAINDGLARAETLPRVIDRAFALRQVLDEIRDRTRGGAPPVEPKVKEKPPENLPPPKPPEKKPEGKKPVRPAPKKTVEKKEIKLVPALEAAGVVQGRVTLNGMPLGTGYVTLTDRTSKREYVTYLRADGAYRFRHPLPPGSYLVSFGPSPTEPGAKPQPFAVPAQMRNPETSGVVAEVRAGENTFDFNLKSK